MSLHLFWCPCSSQEKPILGQRLFGAALTLSQEGDEGIIGNLRFDNKREKYNQSESKGITVGERDEILRLFAFLFGLFWRL